jgi:hypothetical protein
MRRAPRYCAAPARHEVKKAFDGTTPGRRFCRKIPKELSGFSDKIMRKDT